MSQLKKPSFIKVDQIKAGSHCYNIYAKILEIKNSEKETKSGLLKIAEGILGDETASANFKFVGENALNISTGKVIALRNGLSSVVDEHILLELDKFGKITDEPNIEIQSVNQNKNISQVAYEKKVKVRQN